jgi:transposase
MSPHVRDARRLSLAAQEDLRRRVVAAVEDGMSQAEAARVFKVSAKAVWRWVDSFREHGDRGLSSGRRGRRPLEQKALSKAQQRVVCRTIIAQSPVQPGGAGLLWTRKAVAELIERRFRITVSLPTIGKYLRSWGLSPQRPIRRAYEQNPALVRAWLQERYPAIVAAAKADGGIVLWLDESGIGSTAALHTTWAPVGATPVVAKTGQRFRVNLMAAMSNQGALTFTVYEGSLTVARYTDFLARLVAHYGRPVHLITDQHPTHKAKTVTAWLAQHAEQITQYFLPGYSPELNPVEILNADTKRHVAAVAAPRNRRQLGAMIRAHLYRRQKQPHLVAALFRKDEVRYAAA